MSLLLPLFLGAGALIGVPLALHFLRSRTKTQIVFPTLRFLGPTAVRETSRHRLRRLLTLLLRCAIILLVCLAFSRPFWSSRHEGKGHAMVFAIDNSFSMQAGDRWEPKIDAARRQLAKLEQGDQAGILLMNPSPTWLVPVTQNLDQVRAAFAQLKPGFETTRYEGALRVGGDALSRTGAQRRTLVWIADEQRTGWQRVNFSHPLPPGIEVEFAVPAAAVARQAAILKAKWEGAGKDLGLRVTIGLYTPASDRRTVTLTSDGNVIASSEVTLKAGTENSVFLPVADDADDKSRAYRVAMDPDDLAIDDVFYVARQPDDAKRVFLAPLADEKQFDFLRTSLEATKQVTTGALKPETLPEGEWPAHSVFILRGTKPFEAPLAEKLEHFLKQGGVAWLVLDGNPAQTAWLKAHHLESKALAAADDAPARHLQNWDADHPLLAPLKDNGLTALLAVDFYQGTEISGFGAGPIATWEDGSPALAEVSTDGLHFLVSGFDFDRATSNWQLQASFLPFVHATVTWLAQQQPNVGDWRVGDTIPLTGEGTWTQPDETALETHVTGSVRPNAPGIYIYRTATESRLYPVNLAAEESDLTPWPTPDEFASLQSTAHEDRQTAVAMVDLSRDEAENQQRLWWWCLALAAVFLLMELRLANRTSM